MRKSEVISSGLVLLSLIASIYFYSRMPEKIASHWNVRGEVNGYVSKLWGLFLMPFILAGLAGLFAAVPRIDPLKANIEKFRKHYDGFIILFFIFMLSIHFQLILWNLGIKISPNATLPVGLGILFFYTGILCENAKRNWFIGIRTPWTLSSDAVWNKTHKVGGKLFKIAGAVALAGVFFRSYASFFILVPVILISVYTIFYSYITYNRHTQ